MWSDIWVVGHLGVGQIRTSQDDLGLGIILIWIYQDVKGHLRPGSLVLSWVEQVSPSREIPE